MSNVTTGSASKPVMLGARLTPSPLPFMESLWIHHRGARRHLKGDTWPSQGIRGPAILFITPCVKALSEKKSKIKFLHYSYATPARASTIEIWLGRSAGVTFWHTHSGCSTDRCCCLVLFSKCRFSEVAACRERGRRMVALLHCQQLLLQTLPASLNSPEKPP